MMIIIAIGFLSLFVIIIFNPLIILLYTLWQSHYNLKPIDLKQKFGDWAVVTGSTDGIGKEYAKELAKKDINVVLISRSIDKLRATKNEINALNSSIQVKIIQVDFSKGKDEMAKIADELKDIPVGILVNNVGTIIKYPMYIGEMSRTDLWNTINVNIGATTIMTQIVIEKMKKNRKGAIINLCSGTGATPVPLLSIYAASKTFIRYFSDAIRYEYSKYGLTIQTLSPYYVNTKLVSSVKGLKERPVIIPDAATYAKNAINTLGKLNSTTGYWPHDIIRFIISVMPTWYVIRFTYNHVKKQRDYYLQLCKKNDDK